MLLKDYVYSVCYSPAFGFEVTKGGLFDEDEHWLDDSDLALPRKWTTIIEDLLEKTNHTRHIEFELYVTEQGGNCQLLISSTEPDEEFEGEEPYFDAYGSGDWKNGTDTIHLTTITQSFPTFIMTAAIQAVADNLTNSYNKQF